MRPHKVLKKPVSNKGQRQFDRGALADVWTKIQQNFKQTHRCLESLCREVDADPRQAGELLPEGLLLQVERKELRTSRQVEQNHKTRLIDLFLHAHARLIHQGQGLLRTGSCF